MFRFRLRELLAEKERELGCRIPLRELSEATGVSVQVLSSLNSPNREIVTNTAALEAICRYFRCSPDRLLIFDPPCEAEVSCHIDDLYPNRRR